MMDTESDTDTARDETFGLLARRAGPDRPAHGAGLGSRNGLGEGDPHRCEQAPCPLEVSLWRVWK
jgi:hypothetical protein